MTNPPTIGSWCWGVAGIPYKVVRRFRKGSGTFIVISTSLGDRTLPLADIHGWQEELQIGTEIVSDTGKSAVVVEFDLADGMYNVVGNHIVGWLFPCQITIQAKMVQFTGEIAK